MAAASVSWESISYGGRRRRGRSWRDPRGSWGATLVVTGLMLKRVARTAALVLRHGAVGWASERCQGPQDWAATIVSFVRAEAAGVLATLASIGTAGLRSYAALSAWDGRLALLFVIVTVKRRRRAGIRMGIRHPCHVRGTPVSWKGRKGRECKANTTLDSEQRCIGEEFTRRPWYVPV